MYGSGANAKTRYGVQAVLYMARQDRPRAVPISEIATALRISAKFLEDIFAALRVAGIVRSRRGKVGGYQLAGPPAELTVRELVEALEGGAVAPSRGPDDPLVQATEAAFDRAAAAAVDVLGAISIEQLVAEAERLEAVSSSASYMYHL